MFDAVFFDINVRYLVAGFAGGIVHGILVRKATPWEIIGYIVVGGFSSNFFVPTLLVVLPTLLTTVLPTAVIQLILPLPAGPISFVVGMAGFNICRRVDRWAGTWNPFGKHKNE